MIIYLRHESLLRWRSAQLCTQLMQNESIIVDKLDPSLDDVISREEPYFMTFFRFLRVASVSLHTLGFHRRRHRHPHLRLGSTTTQAG